MKTGTEWEDAEDAWKMQVRERDREIAALRRAIWQLQKELADAKDLCETLRNQVAAAEDDGCPIK